MADNTCLPRRRAPLSQLFQPDMPKQAPAEGAIGAQLSVTIDGMETKVPLGTTILDAAKSMGVHIPTLCHHPDLEVAGICRMCVVEVEGQRTLQAACAYPITAPIKIKTYSKAVRIARRHVLDLLLSEHCGDCYSCIRNGICELQQLAEEEETGEGNLVITDTAPLAVSAETEYLARLVDCAIIVVESGVSTRSQLREVANSLQRLDVAAVGFVLNRVKLQKADPAFRRSVRDVEQHLRTQGRSFKKELEKMQKQKKLQSPDIFVFYVSEWKAANPEGDVDAAKAEAKRQGYEVVE